MPFELGYSREVDELITSLEQTDPAKLKKVKRALKRLKENPNDRALHSKKYKTLEGAGSNGADIWQSYIEQGTPGAWRMFWYYNNVVRGLIGVVWIGPHP